MAVQAVEVVNMDAGGQDGGEAGGGLVLTVRGKNTVPGTVRGGGLGHVARTECQIS